MAFSWKIETKNNISSMKKRIQIFKNNGENVKADRVKVTMDRLKKRYGLS